MSDRERCVCTLHRALHLEARADSMCHHHWILLLVCVFFFLFISQFFPLFHLSCCFFLSFSLQKFSVAFLRFSMFNFISTECCVRFSTVQAFCVKLFYRSFFAFIRFLNALCANRERLFRITCENHQREFQKRLFSDETLAKWKNRIRRQSPMYLLMYVRAYVCVYVRARDCNALFFYLKFIPSLHIPFNMYLLRVAVVLPLVVFFSNILCTRLRSETFAPSPSGHINGEVDSMWAHHIFFASVAAISYSQCHRNRRLSISHMQN